MKSMKICVSFWRVLLRKRPLFDNNCTVRSKNTNFLRFTFNIWYFLGAAPVFSFIPLDSYPAASTTLWITRQPRSHFKPCLVKNSKRYSFKIIIWTEFFPDTLSHKLSMFFKRRWFLYLILNLKHSAKKLMSF